MPIVARYWVKCAGMSFYTVKLLDQFLRCSACLASPAIRVVPSTFILRLKKPNTHKMAHWGGVKVASGLCHLQYVVCVTLVYGRPDRPSTEGIDPEVSPYKMTFLHISPSTWQQ